MSIAQADRTASVTSATVTPIASRTMIAADNVTKSYKAGSRQVEILHGVSLGVSSGEMCAVMGPSGSGKSTLLYCLAGLEMPTSGEVTLVDQITTRSSRSALAKLRRTDVGFVFQSYNLVPSLTAYENVALPYRLSHQRPPREVIVETLSALGLAELIEQRPVSMSGGEQQRVALARVLAQRPKIVFADEPTGALDTNSGTLVLDELTRIAHQPDQCVLTVTHDPVVASACDRVMFLRDGVLVHQEVRPSVEQVSEIMAGLAAAVGR